MGPSAQGPDALIGQIVAGYRLQRVLGVGATGAVFLGARAEAEETDEAVSTDESAADASSLPATAAIKLLYVPWQLSGEQAEEFRRRFTREAETLSRLRHPHLLPVLASGQDAATGHLYMVMPHVAGTLASRLTAAGDALPLDEAASILDQLAGALDYAHSQGVIHRDIKPANILLDEQGHVYLGDFGILRLLDESRTQLTTTGGVLGTPEYMAPEQARGEAVGPAADRYALAVVLYQMVTGHLPFEGGAPANIIVRQMQDPPPIPRSYRADLPQPAEVVILKGLAKLPTDRFALSSQMAEAFAAGLAGILSPLVTATGPQQAQTLSDGGVAEAPATPPPTPLPWTPYPEAPALATGAPVARRRKGLLWGSLGAAVLLLLTAAVLAALIRPDLARALFGGGTATATGTSGQVAQGSQGNGGGSSPGVPGYGGTPVGHGGAATTTASATAGGAPGSGTPTDTPGNGGGALPTDTPSILPTNTPTATPLPSLPDSVFVGSYDHSIYALDAGNGSLRWRYQTGDIVDSKVVTANGIVYAGSEDYYLYALNASNGSLRWRFYLNGPVRDRPIVSNGVIYIGNTYTDVYALNAYSGAVIWHYNAGGFSSEPALDNGMVFVTIGYGVTALDAGSGAVRWSKSFTANPVSLPTAANGVVYVSCIDSFSGNYRKVLYALNESNGSVIWGLQTNLNGGVTYGQVAIWNGVLYSEGSDNNLYALNAADGSTIWVAPDSVYGPPIAFANGVMYVSSSGAIAALSTSDGSVIWSYRIPSFNASKPVIADGMVYFGSDSSSIYSIAMSNGAFVWSYQTGDWVLGVPAVGQ